MSKNSTIFAQNHVKIESEECDVEMQDLTKFRFNTHRVLTDLDLVGVVNSLGPIGAVPNANAATITGNTLNLEPADGTFGGVVTATSQIFKGTKAFDEVHVLRDNNVANPYIELKNDSMSVQSGDGLSFSRVKPDKVIINGATLSTVQFGVNSKIEYDVTLGRILFKPFGTEKLQTTRDIAFPPSNAADFQVYNTVTAVESNGWTSVDFNASSRVGSNNPSFVTYRDGLMAYRFPADILDTMKESFFEIYIPHIMAPASGIYIQAHWGCGNAPSSPGNIKWNFEYSFATITTAFPASTTSSVVVARPAAYVHTYTEIGPILAGTSEVGGLLLLRIYRDPTDAQDTSTDPIFLFGVRAMFETIKLCTKNKDKTSGSYYV